MTVNVLLIEDHPLMRTAICATLESDPEIVVRSAAGSGQALFVLLQKEQADLVILDLSLPGMHGLQIIEMMQEFYPDLNILVFSSSLDPEDVSAAIQRGALGYLNKDAHSDELIMAVHMVSRGKAYLPQTIATVLVKELHHSKKESKFLPLELLTRRERQMLALLADGLTNRQLAEEMKISKETVRTHIYNMLKKLPVENRSQLILFAAKYITRKE